PATRKRRGTSSRGAISSHPGVDTEPRHGARRRIPLCSPRSDAIDVRTLRRTRNDKRQGRLRSVTHPRPQSQPRPEDRFAMNRLCLVCRPRSAPVIFSLLFVVTLEAGQVAAQNHTNPPAPPKTESATPDPATAKTRNPKKNATE